MTFRAFARSPSCSSRSGTPAFPFLKGGYVGVDVFFVLSGFLITGILLSRGARARAACRSSRFYARRARRILPAAALTLVATSIAAHHLLNFVRARDVVEDSVWAALFSANIHFAAEGSDYFQQGQPPSPIQHFWSLSAEEQFYLVWPSVLALVLFGLFSRRASLGRLLVVVSVLGAASLRLVDPPHRELADGRLLLDPHPRLGARARRGARRRRADGQRGSRRGCSSPWAGPVSARSGCAAVLYSDNTAFPGYAALLPAVGAALVIAAGLHREGPFGSGRVLSVRPLRYVGDRSYAFYLWHWPVLILAAQRVGHDLPTEVNLLLLVGAFLLSVVSYKLVENPLREAALADAGRGSGLARVRGCRAARRPDDLGLDRQDREAARGRRRLRAACGRSSTQQPRRATRSERARGAAAARRRRGARRGAGSPIPSPLTPPVEQPPRRLLQLPERLRAARRPDEEQGLPARRRLEQRRRSSSSATRTRRCGCRRSWTWPSATAGSCSRSSRSAASRAPGSRRASRATRGTAGRSSARRRFGRT